MGLIIPVRIGYCCAMRSKPLSSAPPRFDAVDALRGFAMVWMTVFHFCFDLNQFGYIHQDFYDGPFWTGQRTLILSLFLFCAGLSQAIALAQGQSWSRFGRRCLQILGCALLVSAGSWWMYPQSYIYFGVLHGIVLMLIIVRLTAHWGRWLWLIGGLAIAFKFMAVYALQGSAMPALLGSLNSPQFNWLGLITHKPITEDYVPLLPWLGVMWWGAACGTSLTRAAGVRMTRQLPALLRPLAGVGRWSLSYYMLHQPVLIGVLMAFGWLVK
jgi:uncharacterized membrane protein